MKINSIKFEKSVFYEVDNRDILKAKKEVIFMGRSNVGKSTLLNTLFNSKTLVKTSSKPGHTKMANLFLINNKFYFTDLPGYGFAKGSKIDKFVLTDFLNWYLREASRNIEFVCMIVDSRLGPTQKDIDIYSELMQEDLKVIIILNKIDKLSKNEIYKSLAHTKKIFNNSLIIPFSSKTKEGKDELLKNIIL